MIDFAGLVGRVTGKGASDTAQAGAGAASGKQAGVAGRGQFAALVDRAAQLGGQSNQAEPRLVVDNGSDGIASGGQGAAVTPPAGLTVVTPDGATTPIPIDGARKPVAKAPHAVPVTPDQPGYHAPIILVDGTNATEKPGKTDPVTSRADGQEGEEDEAVAVLGIAQGATQPGPVMPLPVQPVTVTPPNIQPDATPTNDSPSGAVAKVWTLTMTPAGPIKDAPLIKYADQPVPTISDGPIASTTLPTAVPQPGLAATAQQAASAQTVAAMAQDTPGALPQSAGDQGPLTLDPLPAVTRPASTRSRGVPRVAAGDVAAASVDLSSGTVASPPGDRPGRSTAPAAKTVDGAPFGAGNAVAADTPLRAIVEGLPPVIQSELSAPAAAVRGVAGPSTGQALGDQVIDMGVSGQWIDRVAREIAGLADGSGHSRFTLNPPHLGRLQVDLWSDQGTTNVRLMTETDEAAQRLDAGRQALQNDARVAALSLGTITVEKSSSGSFDQGRDQQRPGGDPAGQMQQQAGQGQAQGRAGNGGQGNQGQASDWVRRVARDDSNQPSDASARAPAQRAADGRVRFA
ncbi:flagellar hook-length control protein FliK [Sphingobium nicotianae]|uniref:Flagellar hook-length control protein FliK n=1 Tax=Sphingobium nicotianae TaxID=2782607 RepID=A0A9X1DAQ5_9SPHN|nr:flagellar hook-length control protein FliK [Sphingobium nicotianae]MBT2186484.1 flagellar hook-length control protein FliK [Sphingobium nicotianae]